MQDFFARQQQARRSTTLLVGYFAAAILLIVLAVYAASRGLYLWSWQLREPGPLPAGSWWDARWFAWTAGTTAAIILAGTLYQLGQLRQGGRRIAELLDARKLPANSTEPAERRLLNIVEEMAIASGCPVPEVFVMDRERGINAFAAGLGAGDGILCLTRGALELLAREEQQGVVAHEFSHLLNGDALINLRLIGWLHGILLLHQIGASVLRGIGHGSGGRGKGPLVAFGLILWLLGYLGYLCGQLIKSAISRQREHLADASAVQFTRNPLGLAGALKKIGGLDQGSLLRHPQAALASHMYFSAGLQSRWWNAFATHPPLTERIRQLDPAFDGRYPEVSPLPVPPPHQGYVQRPRPSTPFQQMSGAAVLAILETIGRPHAEHARQARQWLAGLPAELLAAAREPSGACALCYLLLLSDELQPRTRQLEAIARSDSPAAADQVRKLATVGAPQAGEPRLPLVDLCLPALRALSAKQYHGFRRTITALSRADSRTSLFEYALDYLLRQTLDRQFAPTPQPIVQYYAVRGVRDESALVLSLLARVGHEDPADIAQAFAQGARVLAEPGLELTLREAHDGDRLQLDAALNRLRQTSPALRRRVLAACLETLSWDGRLRLAEVELFRALAAALDCPVPPWLELGPETAPPGT